MKYNLVIPIGKKILSMGEYPTFIPPEGYPVFYNIEGGTGYLFMTAISKMYFSVADMALITQRIVPEEILPAPNPQNFISEMTLLKALAIAQNPELSLNLLK